MSAFLIDEDLPRSVATLAALRGADALHVIHLGLRGQPDTTILAAAVSEGRALVTADKEFGNALAYPPQNHAGVILVRLPVEIDPDLQVERTAAVLASLRDDDLRGAVVVIEPARIRIRRSNT